MLRGIVAGLQKALSIVGAAFTWLITLPYRMYLADSASMLPEPQFATLPADPTDALARPQPGLTPQDLAVHRQRQVLDVVRFISRALRTGDQSELGKSLSKDLRAWLRGLTRPELQALVRSDMEGISNHIAGTALVAGVPRVTPLPARPIGSPMPGPTNTDLEDDYEPTRNLRAAA
ncbi:hypothetical protein [Bradyrhizobium sp.]